MTLYVSSDQRNNMNIEYCLRCNKVRTIVFSQPTRYDYIRISVGKEWLKNPISLPSFCECGTLANDTIEEHQ